MARLKIINKYPNLYLSKIKLKEAIKIFYRYGQYKYRKIYTK